MPDPEVFWLTLTRHIGIKMQTPENMIRVSIGRGLGAYAIKGAMIETNLPTTLQPPYDVARKIVGNKSRTIR